MTKVAGFPGDSSFYTERIGITDRIVGGYHIKLSLYKKNI